MLPQVFAVTRARGNLASVDHGLIRLYVRHDHVTGVARIAKIGGVEEDAFPVAVLGYLVTVGVTVEDSSTHFQTIQETLAPFTSPHGCDAVQFVAAEGVAYTVIDPSLEITSMPGVSEFTLLSFLRTMNANVAAGRYAAASASPNTKFVPGAPLAVPVVAGSVSVTVFFIFSTFHTTEVVIAPVQAADDDVYEPPSTANAPAVPTATASAVPTFAPGVMVAQVSS
jgi:hypothetical protein